MSLRKATSNPSATVDKATKDRVYLLNPMNFIGDAKATTTKNWFIRHGASDQDTGFEIPINLYTKLVNKGYDVNFALPWNRGHSGDDNLDDVFAWVANVVKSTQTPNGQIEYGGSSRLGGQRQGNAKVDGVSGTAAPIVCNYLDIAGSSCGALLPTGNVQDIIENTAVTCIDNWMSEVVLHAADFGLTGYESPAC